MADVHVARSPESHVEVALVSADDLAALSNLFQFYIYDFSEMMGPAISGDGRFHQLDGESYDQAYFVRVDGALAGFALVSRGPSRVIEGESTWWMEEFFVMCRHRRASVGRRAAHLVFERHPGTWEISEVAKNGPAIAFWRRVLAAYGCEEVVWNDPKQGLRPLQRFTARAENPVPVGVAMEARSARDGDATNR